MKNIILLAPPAAGKGTQSDKIIKKYGFVHISTGDLLREKLKENSNLSNNIKEYMEKGDLVPNEIILQLICTRMNSQDCKNGCILDGFPRNYEQAVSLDKLLSSYNRKIDAVIYLDVSKDILQNRIVGRLVCPNCNAIYNDKIYGMNSKEKGICDICHSILVKRDDDNCETFNNRYNTYIRDTKPLIDYYDRRNILYTVNSENTADNVFKSIENIIDNI